MSCEDSVSKLRQCLERKAMATAAWLQHVHAFFVWLMMFRGGKAIA